MSKRASDSSEPVMKLVKFDGDDDKKYYFWRARGRSYTRAEIKTMDAEVISLLPADFAVANVLVPSQDIIVTVVREHFEKAPTGGYVSCKYPEGFPRWLGAKPVVDWARSSDQTMCSLSADDFEQPHLLPLTGRSYSLSAFSAAVTSLLARGEPLRLEDRTLTIWDLATLTLYPNYSLPGWPATSVPPALPPKMVEFHNVRLDPSLAFNASRAEAGKISSMNAAFDSLSHNPADGAGAVDGRIILDAYKRARPGAEGCLVENLVLTDIVFPRGHFVSSLRLRNVSFEHCIMYVDCWCGLSLLGCHFKSCTFVIAGHAKARFPFRVMRLCRMSDDCRIVVCPSLVPGVTSAKQREALLADAKVVGLPSMEAMIVSSMITISEEVFRISSHATLSRLVASATKP